MIVQISSKGFFDNTGTIAPRAGYPTGINKTAFSFFGLFNIFLKKLIGEGV